MSSRQLRKIRQLQQAQLQPDLPTAEDSDESEEAVTFQPKRPQASLFAALGAQDDDDDNDDDGDGNGDEVGTTAQDAKADDADDLPVKSTSSSSRRKSKKKKKKAKKREDADSGPDERKVARAHQSEDEIDKALEALGIDDATHSSGAGTEARAGFPRPSNPKMDELLNINSYRLRPTNEMRHMFGREVVHSAIAQEEAEQESARRALARRRGTQNVDIEVFLQAGPREPRLPDISLKKNVFVLGREHWPRASAGGLTMKVVAQDREYTEYTFVHDDVYEGVQAGFFHFVMIGDPMHIIHLAKQQPYHVSTLLQASNIAKGDGNAPLAAELCERALFSFGRITTSGFRRDLENGTARLDFNRPENRQFWLAGYMYLRSLTKKGTYRTALEWAKLLFALDRRDPYMMRLFIHTLAIRAGEAAWFVDFVEADAEKHDPSHAYMAQSRPIAQLQLGDMEGAKKSIREGVAEVPWLYAALFQALQLDLPPSIWGLQPPGDHELWTAFYIHLTKDLWNGHPRAVSLLKDVVGKLPKQTVNEIAGPLGFATLDLARVVFLEGQAPLLAHVPKHFLSMEPNFEFDPLPPEEQHNIFTSEALRLPWRQVQEQRERREQHPRNIAGAEEFEAQDQLWRQFLEDEGRRAVAGGEDDDGGDNDDEDGDQATRMQRIGMQAWIMQQLGPWVGAQRPGDGEGEEGGGEGEGGGGRGEGEEGGAEGGEEGAEDDDAVAATTGDNCGVQESEVVDVRQRAFQRTATMPGAWPTVETDSEDEDLNR